VSEAKRGSKLTSNRGNKEEDKTENKGKVKDRKRGQ
jgi:hypothetical protein